MRPTEINSIPYLRASPFADDSPGPGSYNIHNQARQSHTAEQQMSRLRIGSRRSACTCETNSLINGFYIDQMFKMLSFWRQIEVHTFRGYPPSQAPRRRRPGLHIHTPGHPKVIASVHNGVQAFLISVAAQDTWPR
jgi:hypothetical protein